MVETYRRAERLLERFVMLDVISKRHMLRLDRRLQVIEKRLLEAQGRL